MKNFLATIIDNKQEEVREARRRAGLQELRDRPLFSAPRRSLAAALSGRGPAVIAEVKKASPSRGVLSPDFDHRRIAREYLAGGADALSVLTDERFFQGRLSYLEELRSSAAVPLLRKDFIIDSYQLFESKAYGADAVLLIAAALPTGRLRELHAECRALGLECLVEIHSEEEIAALSGVPAEIIGVNNRNLSTFETDLRTSLRLAPLLPPEAIAVSESGIRSAEDVRRLAAGGFRAVLVGEMLMMSADPAGSVRELKSVGDLPCERE